MPHLTLPAVTLYYERSAKPDGRPAVLFLHGMGSASADWALQFPAFQPQYRTITVDLRAHGQSSDPGDWFTVETLADDVAAVLDYLGESAVHVVGLSLGGATALTLAVQGGSRVRSVTVVNGFARYIPARRGGLQRVLTRTWLLLTAPMSSVATYIAGGLFPTPDQSLLYEAAVASLSRNRRRTYWAAMVAIARFDLRPRLKHLTQPTLIVAGANDGTIALEAQQTLRARLPQAQWAVIPDSGHATPMDQSAVFNRLVLDFLARQ